MNEADLLARIAGTLRQDIGPAVADEFARTQAYMAAVVLQKLALQLSHARTHALAMDADMDALLADLEAYCAASTTPDATATAMATLKRTRDKAALCDLVAALYADRVHMGEVSFSVLINRVRRTLRADLDRQLVYAE